MEREGLRKFILETTPASSEERAKTRPIIDGIKRVSSRILSASANRLALERELFRIERGGLLPSFTPDDLEENSSEIMSVGHVMQRLDDGSSIAIMTKPFTDDSPVNGTILIVEKQKQQENPNPDKELEFETYYIRDGEVLRTSNSSGSITRATEDELTQLLKDIKKMDLIKPIGTAKPRGNIVQNLN